MITARDHVVKVSESSNVCSDAYNFCATDVINIVWNKSTASEATSARIFSEFNVLSYLRIK